MSEVCRKVGRVGRAGIVARFGKSRLAKDLVPVLSSLLASASPDQVHES